MPSIFDKAKETNFNREDEIDHCLSLLKQALFSEGTAIRTDPLNHSLGALQKGEKQYAAYVTILQPPRKV